jgi:hypothetical protein
MANGHGGYRRPTTPAAVSGPGAASRRTDGRPSEDSMKQAARYISGMPQGEAAEVNAVATSAPLAAAPGPQDAPAMPALVPLTAPSQRPDEPITAGAPFGAGPNSVSLPPPAVDHVAMLLRAMYQASPSPELRGLIERMNMEA